MKRQSRKKRNLEYIRFKNRLRKFEPIDLFFKDSMLKVDFEYIESIVLDKAKEIKDKYSVNLDGVDYRLGVTAEDCLNDTVTIRARMQRLKHNEK